MILGERLKQLRKDKYSQEELAELLHVHNNTVSKWETGGMEPRAKRVTELAQLLGTTSAYLLGDTDDPAPVKQFPFAHEDKKISDTTKDDGRNYKLIYVFSNGEKLELPATPEYTGLFRDLVIQGRQTITSAPVAAG